MPLLKKIFTWGHEINPSQPLSAAVWSKKLTDLNKFQLENSDVITYHNYSNDTLHRQAIDSLKRYKRPLIGSEYMARKTTAGLKTSCPC